MQNKIMRLMSFQKTLLLFGFLLAPLSCYSQAPAQSGSLLIAGHADKAPVVQISGKSYVDIESLARVTNGSISFQGNQITLTLPGSGTAIAAPTASPPPKPGFSKDFLRAGIEEMAVIREWRIAIVNAVQNNYPVAEEWVSGHRRTADSKLQLVSAAASTDSDRSGLALLSNEFNNMQKLSDKYLAMHKSLTYISPDAFDNDPLDQQVLDCSRGLASLAASSQFEDVAACH